MLCIWMTSCKTWDLKGFYPKLSDMSRFTNSVVTRIQAKNYERIYTKPKDPDLILSGDSEVLFEGQILD